LDVTIDKWGGWARQRRRHDVLAADAGAGLVAAVEGDLDGVRSKGWDAGNCDKGSEEGGVQDDHERYVDEGNEEEDET